ncbi:hypothetical protein [Thermus caldifontis]|uniref:hypothetical protein n=1 Tax=Thermus caldifontis TaxID=1930763 RepID=UPI000DF26101|nr:hypothetical protein [Thermus caldifontis]
MSLPIRLTDLGSQEAHQLDFTREALWERMDPGMGRKAVSLPVFLVNPGQMDLLYPQERLRFLDPEAVRNWVRRQRERRREREEVGEEDALRGLEAVEGEGYRRYKEVVAVGLYLGDPPADALWSRLLSQGDAPSLPKPDGPAIFLCPERILDWAYRVGVDPQLVLDKVYYHELAHALMDTGPTPYKELWGRIVEESLANWVAFDRFRGREARWVQRLIQDQPPEYQGYAHLGEALRVLPQVEAVLKEVLWRLRYFRPFWKEWLDWWEWAAERGLPPVGLGDFLPRDFKEGDRASGWVYRAWTGAKRGRMDQEFWAVYAHHLLLEAFA